MKGMKMVGQGSPLYEKLMRHIAAQPPGASFGEIEADSELGKLVVEELGIDPAEVSLFVADPNRTDDERPQGMPKGLFEAISGFEQDQQLVDSVSMRVTTTVIAPAMMAQARPALIAAGLIGALRAMLDACDQSGKLGGQREGGLAGALVAIRECKALNQIEPMTEPDEAT